MYALHQMFEPSFDVSVRSTNVSRPVSTFDPDLDGSPDRI